MSVIPPSYLQEDELNSTGLNIGVHKEAAEHCASPLSLSPPSFPSLLSTRSVVTMESTRLTNLVLAALSMHTRLGEEDAKRYDSMSIWSTLRRALVAMVRYRPSLLSPAIGSICN